METRAHCTLKMLAVEFLRSLGCQAVATEVSCPIARYRIDVAGYLDTIPLADLGGAAPCRRRLREELHRIRRNIEERRIKVNEPHLRCSGSSLFPELEDWDFLASRSRGSADATGASGSLWSG